MSQFKKRFIAFATLVAMTLSTVTVSAAESTYVGGRGYQEYRTAPNLASGIALGVIATAAIVAVALQNSTNEHSHAHGK